MNADEIVMWLRQNNRKSGWTDIDRMMDKSADLIESLQAELTASQRREMAAVEDLKFAAPCCTCKHSGISGFPEVYMFKCPYSSKDYDCEHYEWRFEGGRE
jgi:hypothetical protein